MEKKLHTEKLYIVEYLDWKVQKIHILPKVNQKLFCSYTGCIELSTAPVS